MLFIIWLQIILILLYIIIDTCTLFQLNWFNITQLWWIIWYLSHKIWNICMMFNSFLHLCWKLFDMNDFLYLTPHFEKPTTSSCEHFSYHVHIYWLENLLRMVWINFRPKILTLWFTHGRISSFYLLTINYLTLYLKSKMI